MYKSQLWPQIAVRQICACVLLTKLFRHGNWDVVPIAMCLEHACSNISHVTILTSCYALFQLTRHPEGWVLNILLSIKDSSPYWFEFKEAIGFKTWYFLSFLILRLLANLNNVLYLFALDCGYLTWKTSKTTSYKWLFRNYLISFCGHFVQGNGHAYFVCMHWYSRSVSTDLWPLSYSTEVADFAVLWICRFDAP